MIKGELAARAQQLLEQRTPFVVATVVGARRPTSVRPGFSAIVLADGTIEGFVGGACAQSSVRLYSLRALETGEPLLLRLVPDDAAEEHGEPLDGAVVERNPCLSGGALEIFLEPQLPAARIVIVGSAPIARALARVAAAAGYDVASGDRAQPASGDAALVVASHGDGEEHVLAGALAAGVPYVALVASTARGQAIRAELEVPDELRAQLHTPAGLDIGARAPEEVAISILAELIAGQRLHAPAPAATQTAIDPVCGMQVVISASTPSLELGGERVFFCGAGCRDAYAREHAAR